MKKTIFTLITILAATTGFAQNTSNDSIRSKVREIKLSEKYVYAEAGSMAGFTEAQSIASGKLHAAAITLMAEHQKGKEEMKSTWAKAEKQALFMEYNNGSLFKIFAYVPKNSLIEMQPKTEVATHAVSTPPQPALAVAPIVEDTLTDAPSVAETDSIIQIVAQQTGQPVTPQDSHVQKEKVYNVDENIAALILKMLPIADSKHSSTEKPDMPQSSADQAQTATEEKATEEQTAQLEVPAPWTGISESTRRVLTDLLAMETYESAMIYLSAMKEDGRLMYGSLKKVIMPERSYLLIIKDGKVETVLSKGTGERTNLKSLKQESIRKYIGYGIIWIQVFDKN
ncbi:hypothetical protein [uncultured Bacteroides sp.]|uniref:hypothetical protein n=1 Tax=uncultured Bacteroides sp. TaxID=162156 RepID=UPI00261C819E|nr:hypothetical protein [uncultured Bacteroides sp.]